MKIKRGFVGMVFVFVVFAGYSTSASAKTVTGTVIKTATPTATTTKAVPNYSTEESVKNFFKDTPVMIEIARCESKFRQYTDSGNPLRSSGMIGVFQFYESIHSPGARALGFDLATTEGNLGYAKHLFETEGTTPWNGSRYCWETAIVAPATISDDVRRAKLLEQITILTKLIALLQRQLDAQKLQSL